MSFTDSAFIKAYRNRADEEPEISLPYAGTSVVTELAGITSERITRIAPIGSCSTIYADAGPGSSKSSHTPAHTGAAATVQPSQTDAETRIVRIDRPATSLGKGPHGLRRKRETAADASTQPAQPAKQEVETVALVEPPEVARKAMRKTLPSRPAHPIEVEWEVDRFNIPTVAQRLQAECAVQLTEVVRGVLQHAWQGRNILAITSFTQGEGVTTLATALAHLASTFDIPVALVDGNVDHPDVGTSLGLAYPQGWEALDDGVPLAEIAIQSAAGEMVVVPYGEETASAPDQRARRAADLIRELTHRFELVVLDAGPMFSAAHNWFAPPAVEGIHGAIVVRDTRTTQESKLQDVLSRLAAGQIQNVGIIENFMIA